MSTTLSLYTQRFVVALLILALLSPSVAFAAAGGEDVNEDGFTAPALIPNENEETPGDRDGGADGSEGGGHGAAEVPDEEKNSGLGRSDANDPSDANNDGQDDSDANNDGVADVNEGNNDRGFGDGTDFGGAGVTDSTYGSLDGEWFDGSGATAPDVANKNIHVLSDLNDAIAAAYAINNSRAGGVQTPPSSSSILNDTPKAAVPSISAEEAMINAYQAYATARQNATKIQAQENAATREYQVRADSEAGFSYNQSDGSYTGVATGANYVFRDLPGHEAIEDSWTKVSEAADNSADRNFEASEALQDLKDALAQGLSYDELEIKREAVTAAATAYAEAVAKKQEAQAAYTRTFTEVTDPNIILDEALKQQFINSYQEAAAGRDIAAEQQTAAQSLAEQATKDVAITAYQQRADTEAGFTYDTDNKSYVGNATGIEYSALEVPGSAEVAQAQAVIEAAVNQDASDEVLNKAVIDFQKTASNLGFTLANQGASTDIVTTEFLPTQTFSLSPNFNQFIENPPAYTVIEAQRVESTVVPGGFEPIIETEVALTAADTTNKTLLAPTAVVNLNFQEVQNAGILSSAPEATLVETTVTAPVLTNIKAPEVEVTAAEIDFATRVALAENFTIRDSDGAIKIEALLGVIDTMRNRVLSESFPNTLQGVLSQDWAFSPVKFGTYKKAQFGPTGKDYKATKALVEDVMAGKTVPFALSSKGEAFAFFGNVPLIIEYGKARQETKINNYNMFNDPESITIKADEAPWEQHTYGNYGNPNVPNYVVEPGFRTENLPTFDPASDAVLITNEPSATTPALRDNVLTNVTRQVQAVVEGSPVTIVQSFVSLFTDNSENNNDSLNLDPANDTELGRIARTVGAIGGGPVGGIVGAIIGNVVSRSDLTVSGTSAGTTAGNVVTNDYWDPANINYNASSTADKQIADQYIPIMVQVNNDGQVQMQDLRDNKTIAQLQAELALLTTQLETQEAGQTEYEKLISRISDTIEALNRADSSEQTSIVADEHNSVVFSDGRYAPITVNGTQLSAQTADGPLEARKYVYLVTDLDDATIFDTQTANSYANQENVLEKITAATVDLFDGETEEFTLADVVDVTHQYVDPKSDEYGEEYYIYNILKNDGSVVVVESPFTTNPSTQARLFSEVGYRGDPLLLIANSTQTEVNITQKAARAVSNILESSLALFGFENPHTQYADVIPTPYNAFNNRLDASNITSLTFFMDAPVSCPDVPGSDQGYVYTVLYTDTNDLTISNARCGSGSAANYVNEVARHLYLNYNFAPMSVDDLSEKTIFSFDSQTFGVISVDNQAEADDFQDDPLPATTLDQDTLSPTTKNINPEPFDSMGISFEIKVTDEAGELVQNWTENDVVITPDDTIALRWEAPNYNQCLPFLADSGNYSLTRRDSIVMLSGDTEAEGYDIFERSGTYSIECSETPVIDDVDVRTITVTIE